jgi:uncharacterized oxidoreductase
MKRYQHETIEWFVQEIFQQLGTSKEVAAATASSLVAADLRGHSAQGVLRVPWIAEKIRNGEIDPGASPSVERLSDATARLTASSAVGQFVGKQAVDTALDLAEHNGVGVVTIRDANDLGRVGEWAEQATDADMIFECLVNARGHPSVAPNGCATRILSTNPIALGLPTFNALKFPIVLDIATSQVAHGQIEEYAQWGKDLPAEWTTTRTGEPITDPESFLDGEGAILPLGGRVTGHKGFGLGIMNELLAGILSDGFVAGQPDRPPSGNDAVFLALDPTVFTTPAALEERLTTFVDYLRSAECASEVSVGAPATGSDGQLRLPGEGSYQRLQERRDVGIPLPKKTVVALRDLAADLDCSDALPNSFTV